MTDPGGPKSPDAYRTISEVAADLKLPQHVLRFWETRFAQVKPLKRAGGRRFYRPEDVDLLRAVKTLLYSDGYTIKGVQRILREQGPRAVAALAASPARRGPTRQTPAAPAVIEADVVPVAEPVPRSEPSHEAASKATAVDAERRLPTYPAARLREVLAELEACARLLAQPRITPDMARDGGT